MINIKDWHFPKTINMMNVHDDTEREEETDVLVADPELQAPPMYAVIMYNDDYTPMEFVVMVLMQEFKQAEDQAVETMLAIHHDGHGIAGIYPKDIAETKAKKCNNLARKEGYPLLTQIEPYKE
ncbi:ATP-dependent Clp protease adaptor ClpS [Psychrobacter sp. HD31]|uniref:ATP-dependent Clp protease adaptor ClpS n=1 Tax=Psychrobacter sp. HD31 TaxID=3112003 RepID=UPI003DA39698